MNKYAVAKVDDIKKNGQRIVNLKGMEVGIFFVDGEFYAWRNVCPHAGAPICEGPVRGTNLPSMVYEYKYGKDDQILRCPWHGWEFNLKTGEHLVNSGVKLKSVLLEKHGEDIYLLIK